jgi:HAD superfamily hydrolase (TIGR01509 family)
MITCVVFDMDGLLIDSEPVWHQARAELFHAYGFEWTDEDQEHTMGVNTTEWATYMAGRLDNRLTAAQAIQEMISRMEARYRENLPLMPGATEVISLLANRYTLGLASGSHPRLIQATMDTTEWRKDFSEIVSGDDVNRGKPAPDIYLEITRRLQVPVAQTAVLEDSANGILAGCAAGMKVIAVPNTHIRPPENVINQADIVIESLLDFSAELLRGL